MAKRFTDTNKYKKPFIRGLLGAYKLLWDYLYHDCDHAGIWIVDFEIAQIYVGSDMPVNKEKALELFNADEIRIVSISGGAKWFIKSFIDFQYGKLNPVNRAHLSVINILSKNNIQIDTYLVKPLISPLQGAMVKDKDKDKDKVKDKDKDSEEPYNLYTLQQVKDSGFLCGLTEEQCQQYFDHYNAQGWVLGNGQPIVNLPSALAKWRNNSCRFETKKSPTRKAEVKELFKKAFADE